MTSPSPFRAMLERTAYAFHLMLLVGSIVVIGLELAVGFETGRPAVVWLSLGGLVLSAWLHLHGYAHWHFRECDASFELPRASDAFGRVVLDGKVVDEFVELLRRFEAEPEVWRRGELRRLLVDRLAATPGLREEFAEDLAAHPDL